MALREASPGAEGALRISASGKIQAMVDGQWREAQFFDRSALAAQEALERVKRIEEAMPKPVDAETIRTAVEEKTAALFEDVLKDLWSTDRVQSEVWGKMLDQLMSRAVLGPELTAQASEGSYAVGRVWDEALRDMAKAPSKEETKVDNKKSGETLTTEPNAGRTEVQPGVYVETDRELYSRLVVAYEIREGKPVGTDSSLWTCGTAELDCWAAHLKSRRRAFNAQGQHIGEFHNTILSMAGWVKEKSMEPTSMHISGDLEVKGKATVGGKEIVTKDPPLTEKYPVLKTLQTDAVDAAYRTAGSQFVKLTREPLIALLTRHLGPDDLSLRAKIASFLDTELGTALLASLLSLGLSATPQTASEVPQRLARELRVKAMGGVGDVVADVVMGPLRQVMAFYLQDVGGIAVSSPPALAEHTPSGLGVEVRERVAVPA